MNPGKRQIRTDCMTMGRLEFDGDSHESSAHWFGMTVLFGARTSLFKFQFVCLLNKTDIHIFFCVIVVSKRQKREGPRTSSGKQMKLWDLFFRKSESVSFSLSAVSACFALSSDFLYHAAEKLGSMAAILKPSH